MTILNSDSAFIVLATSTLTTILTAIVSFWRFRRERLWELKVKTYSVIMESLHDIKKCSNYYYDDYEESMRSITDDVDYLEWLKERELRKKIYEKEITTIDLLKKSSAAALQRIEKIIDESSFIINEQASNELTKLGKEYAEIEHIDDIIDIEWHVEKNKKLIDNCVAKIRDIAKNDIQIMPEYIQRLVDKLKGAKIK